MEEARRIVLQEQAAVVKRALATASEQTQRETRRHRVAALLILFLLGGCWRFFMGGSLIGQGTLRSEMEMVDAPGVRPVQGPLPAPEVTNSSG